MATTERSREFDMSPFAIPGSVTLDAPAGPLRWLSGDPSNIPLGTINPIEMWGLVALATLARTQGPAPLRVSLDSNASSVRFAHGVGFPEVIEGRSPTSAAEVDRTVKLTRVHRDAPTEPVARQISSLIVTGPNRTDTERTLYYVLNELLRNVVQHSQDPLGGIVGAQINRGGRNAARPFIQVAVADAGIGIFESLRSRHAKLTDPRESLDKALWPHFSSAFDEGETGSANNAGMGLFFIAELTKLVGGRLVVASKGATLVLQGDENFSDPHGKLSFLESGLGFPGTLVAFEMPADEEQHYDAMIETIRERARERTPRRAAHRWLKYVDAPPPEVQRFIVRLTRVEDADAARAFAEKELVPRFSAHQPVTLDFEGIPVCTQSYVHALLYFPLRLAWAMKTPIYILNAKPAVRSTLELLENYAHGG